MRFLITTAPGPGYDAKAEAEKPFDPALFDAHMKLNEEMHRAGVLVTAEGVNPSRPGMRVVVRGGARVVDGPFTETKELLGGFYLIDVSSLEEAVRWAMRVPVGMGTADVLTILPMTVAEDLPPDILRRIEATAPTWSKTLITPKGGTR